MNKIPTAEEFVNQYDWENSTLDIPSVLIEFAKLHVKAALEAAAENAYITKECGCKTESECYSFICCNDVVNKDSILNAYPETLIK